MIAILGGWPSASDASLFDPSRRHLYTTQLFSICQFRSFFSMYAVIRTGGKQYRVSAGDQLEVEKLDVQAGAELVLSEVLMLGEGSQVSIGAPLVTGATVTATVLGQGKGDKVHIFKMRRRKHYRKSQGHRQSYTSIRIDSITAAN